MQPPVFLIDARGTQQGYKQHSARGLGHYARHLLEELPNVVDPVQLRFLVEAGTPVPETLLKTRVGLIHHQARLLRIPGARHLDDQLRLPSTLQNKGCTLGHFLFHQDAPLRAPFPVVVTIPDMITRANRELYGARQRAKYAMLHRFDRMIAHSAAAIITISDYSKQDIVRFFDVNPACVHVTPLGVDRSFFAHHNRSAAKATLTRFGLKEGFLLYVGGIDPRKNLHTLFLALSRLTKTEGRHLQLAIAGRIETQREYPQLLRTINDLRLGDTIRLLGFVPDEDLPTIYASAALFVFPSLSEGFGLPVLQAMAAGTPVVTSRRTSIPEVAGDAVLYVDPIDAGEMAAQIGRVLDDGNLAAQLSEMGRQRASRFSWHETAARTARVYEALAQQFTPS